MKRTEKQLLRKQIREWFSQFSLNELKEIVSDIDSELEDRASDLEFRLGDEIDHEFYDNEVHIRDMLHLYNRAIDTLEDVEISLNELSSLEYELEE